MKGLDAKACMPKMRAFVITAFVIAFVHSNQRPPMTQCHRPMH